MVWIIRIIMVGLAAVVMTATGPSAQAQALSFDRLGLRIDEGDHVTVTDHAGRVLRGRVVDLSASGLSLQAGDVRHDLDGGDISVIRWRERDSLANGAWVGFLSGVGFLAAMARGSDGDAGLAMTFGALFGAAGAGIGVYFDAIYQPSRVIYGSEGSDRRLAVSPVLSASGDGGGVSVSLGF